MKQPSFRACFQYALLILLIVAALLPAASQAGPPRPTATPAVPPPDSSSVQSYGGDALGQTEVVPLVRPQDDGGTASVTDATNDETPGTTMAVPSLLAPARGRSDINTPQAQGVVTLDVATPETIRPGEYITYTYSFVNTGSSPVSGAIVEARWANFSTNFSASSAIVQHCPAAPDSPAGCVVLPGSVSGPTVTSVATCPPRSDIVGTRFCFSLGQLAAKRSGKFSIRLRSNRFTYPQTGQSPIRPSGSGLVYLDGSSTPTSEDTANTLVVGPVIALSKTTNPSLKIYTGETAEFVIRVGNATGAGDSLDGQVRADARPATKLVIKDTFPVGAAFVSATGNPVVDQAAKTVTWTITGPLTPGKAVDFHVVFRKIDVNLDCTRLTNAAYNVSYEDPEPSDGTSRYTVQGKMVSVTVIVPLVVKSITPTPFSVPFGADASLTIVVQNFWNQPLNGVQLNYAVQSNASFIPGSASPAPSSAPDGTKAGGRVTWTFNPSPGNKTAPTELTFTLRVRAGYATQPQMGTGKAWIVAPAGIPAACSELSRSVSVSPRLRLTKTTDADPVTRIGDAYSVTRLQPFSYRIEVKNSGPSDATGVSIGDAIPAESGANFSLVAGSATLNGQPRAPDSFVNGPGGSIIWNNLVVPANSTIRLDYNLRVDGRDYWKYCNKATASRAGEVIDGLINKVCVKINPRIEIAKVIVLPDGSTTNKHCADAGGEVRFRLTLTNREATTYRVGLYDMLGSTPSRLFEFVRQESGYAAPQPHTNFGNGLIWPVVNLAPDQSISATIVARVPGDAQSGDYVNEGLFRNETDVIRNIPPMTVSVRTPCIEFSKSSDRTTISLQDRLVYTLQIKNNRAQTTGTLTAMNYLPQGFSYVGIEASSDIRTTPLQQKTADQRTRLSWTIPPIAPYAVINVKFFARSGNTVGSYENWFTLSGGTCVASALPNVRGCKIDTDGTIYAFQAVTVQPLITMEPKINVTGCVQPRTTLTYRLSIVNTNVHDYTGTSVNVTLPPGLRYVRALNTTPAPRVTTNSQGASTITWSGLRILAKPPTMSSSQLSLEIELKAGQVWGQLRTQVTTTSADGLIPRKDGAFDPTVLVCSATRAIATEVFPQIARVGDDVVYQISVTNPSAAPLTLSVVDQLPAALRFREPLSPIRPTVNGNTLTWTGLKVPAAVNGKAGLISLRFKARLTSVVPGNSYVNTAQGTSSSATVNTTYSSIPVQATALVVGPLTNQGFEAAFNGINPDAWSQHVRATRSSILKRSGSFALKFAASDNSSFGVNQTVTGLQGGKAYNISSWFNIPDTADAFTFAINVRWLDARNNTLGGTPIIQHSASTRGTWQQASANLVAPAGTTNAVVQIVASSLNGAIYVDDVAFWP